MHVVYHSSPLVEFSVIKPKHSDATCVCVHLQYLGLKKAVKESAPRNQHGLRAKHLLGDCIRNGEVGNHADFTRAFWRLQRSPTQDEYQTTFQTFQEKWPKSAAYLEKQEGPWCLMDFNQEIDSTRVRTLGLKTKNMSEIQNALSS